MKKLSNEELLVELEGPFPVGQVLWRVTNTANNREIHLSRETSHCGTSKDSGSVLQHAI
jgi:hypothetical protein